MLKINVTDNALQNQTLVLANGTSFTITMYFNDSQTGWFFNNITYGTFIINGLRITNSPNMLYQFVNQIPFGLACFTMGNREPTQVKDFSSGASSLYILSQAECQAYVTYVQGGKLPP